MKSYIEIAKEVKAIAVETGLYIKTEAETFKRSDIKTKGLNDFVSYVDLEAEKRIVESLRKIIPDAGFITEEGTESEISDLYNWVIDPLDGTTNFVHGLPPYSISIGLTYKDEIIVGVVYEISSGEIFWATQSGGAWLNNKKIEVSGINNIQDSLIGTGFPYKDYTKLTTYLETLEYFIKNTHGVRRQGSAAIDLAHVACGRLDAFFEYNLNPWDVCAGALIIREAGGKVTDFSGGENKITGAEIIATNNLLYLKFLEIIKTKFINP